MKRSKQCPKCQSRRIGYLPEQPDAEETEDKDGLIDIVKGLSVDGEERSRSGSRAVGRGEAIREWWGRYRFLFGTLEAYVCADCGYHETYVKEPTSLPWEKLVGFSWVNPPPTDGGPFR